MLIPKCLSTLNSIQTAIQLITINKLLIMKRIKSVLFFMLVSVSVLFAQSYNNQGEWYNQHKIENLKLMTSYDFNFFVRALSSAPDSIGVDGDLIFLENTSAQSNHEVSPITIGRAPKKDRISILDDISDMSLLKDKVTITGFNLQTSRWSFNNLVRVGDSIDILEQLGGSCYNVSPYESGRNWGVILWSPEEIFPEDLKFLGSESAHFYYDNNGVITGITLFLNFL